MVTMKESPLMHWNREAIKDRLPLLQHNHYVVLDIETTGLSPKTGGRIIEIGAVRVVNGEVKEEYQTFIDPQQKLYGKTIELTGITNEMVAGQRTIGQVLPEFREFIGDAIVVAHNAKFDWNRFLVPFFKDVGLHLENEVLCTYELFKKADPKRGAGAYRLPMLCLLFGITIDNYHRAIDDAVATAKAFIGIQRELVDVTAIAVEAPVELKKEPVAHTEVVVKRVKHWEKRVSASKMMRRHYISLTNGEDFGTVYFDIGTRTWYNKDFEKPLNFAVVEKKVLEFLSLKTTMDLCHYKN